MGSIKEAFMIGEEIKEHLTHVLGEHAEIDEFQILDFCYAKELKPQKALQLFLSQTDPEILWSLMRRDETPSFLQWCNEPVYRAPNDLGFQTRVKALFPEYTQYIVIDSTGNSVAPPGKFFSAEEVYELYRSTRLYIPSPGSTDVTDIRI